MGEVNTLFFLVFLLLFLLTNLMAQVYGYIVKLLMNDSF